MTTSYDYALLEFTANLAEAEASYGEKLHSIIDTFSQSRLDLPLKRLSEIAKVHGRAAHNLRKYMDPKKNEHLNLWKLCNVYSCYAVDLDKAMRETRSSLRTKMAVDGTAIEKPKRRNIFNSILTNSVSHTPEEKPERPERRWFPKLTGYDRKSDSRTSRKATSTSLEHEKEERSLAGSKSTPATPPIVRSHAPLVASVSVTPDTRLKPPRPPRAGLPDIPVPPVPTTSPPSKSVQYYATPIYGDMQQNNVHKAVGHNNNNRIVLVEEHSLRHQDDSHKDVSLVKVRTDVEVAREARRNESPIVNVYESPSINKSHYVNIRPPIAQKPHIISPDRAPSKPEFDPSPTYISVDCHTTVPIPSPRNYNSSNETPTSQRSSSSAYSSNYSTSSSTNVTSFVIDNQRGTGDETSSRIRHPTLEHSEIFISGLVDEILKSNDNDNQDVLPIYGPEKQSTATDTSMAVVPFKHSEKEEDPEFQKAVQESLSLSPHISEQIANMNLEDMIRNPNFSTGISNSGNTCWFNCLAQMLYSLPKFRSVIYHCIPATWTAEPIVNIRRDDVPFAELLLGFRRLFAELHFTEASFISAGDLLKIVDTLYRKNRKNTLPTIGSQQDATEMLILIFEWLETALKAAVYSHLHPELQLDALEENIVVAASTTTAPNSEMAGTAPPDYSFASDSSVVMREAQSRPNSPVARQSPEFAVPLAPSGSRGIVDTPSIDEAMDTSEALDSRVAYSPPAPAKIARIPKVATEVAAEPSDDLTCFVSDLNANFEKLFMAKLYSTSISDDNQVTSETVTKNCPQIFQLQISYGNLHDALEANTYDTGRNAVSHVRNLYEELPAVIFMGLSRFDYGKSTSKLHEKFTFPRILFMDRYLRSNVDIVQSLREKQQIHREELAKIRAQRLGLCQYPCQDAKEARLTDIFETTIAALKNSNVYEEATENVDFIGPLAPSAYDKRKPVTSFVQNLGKIFPAFPNDTNTQNAIHTLEALKTQLTNEEERLMQEEVHLEQLIENTFEVAELQKNQYELRAMIVHSGEASRGHYWTYRIKKSIDGTEFWEKLNDSKTDKVAWSTVEEDAFGNGSTHSPSAYLLMYVRSDAEWLDAADNLTTQEALEQLPIDLSEYVKRQQKNWKQELQKFRDRKDGAQKEDNAFTWQKSVDRDENANPEMRQEDWLALPLSDHKTEFHPEDVKEVNRLTEYFWNFIVKIEPERFINMEDILTHHLKAMMLEEKGGLYILEKMLNRNYPLKELREDAENDVERVYHTFITTYVEEAINLKPCSRLTNLILYVKYALKGIDSSALRFLLVTALTHCNVEAIAKRAQLEISAFIEADEVGLKRISAMANLLAEVFEIGNLTAFGTRRALELCSDHGKRGDPKVEDIYLAMSFARMARVCFQVLQHDANFLCEEATCFVSAESLQVATALLLMNQLKALFNRISNKQVKVADLEFLLPCSERRITVDTIMKEIEASFCEVNSWVEKKVTTENQNDSIEPATADGVYAEKLDTKRLREVFGSCVGVIAACDVVRNDATKEDFIHKIHSAMHIPEISDNKLPYYQKMVEPGTVHMEIEKIRNLSKQIGNVNKKIADISLEMQTLFSRML